MTPRLNVRGRAGAQVEWGVDQDSAARIANLEQSVSVRRRGVCKRILNQRRQARH
jgi:hypothetical protein